jgi:hypothetical protein
LLLATPAALGASPVEGELAARIGFTTAGSVGSETPYGAGVGLRGGVAIHGAYVGLEAMNYVGTPSDRKILHGGLELGYGFKAADGALTLRPTLGFGVNAAMGAAIGDGPGEPATRAEGGYYVAPGFTVLLVALPPHFFVGADVSVELMPGAHYDSPTSSSLLPVLATHAQLGWVF